MKLLIVATILIMMSCWSRHVSNAVPSTKNMFEDSRQETIHEVRQVKKEEIVIRNEKEMAKNKNLTINVNSTHNENSTNNENSTHNESNTNSYRREDYKKNMTKLIAYLSKFGHIPYLSPFVMYNQTHRVIRAGIRSIQKLGGLSQTGVIDNATNNLLNSPRCQNMDIGMIDTASGRKKRYALSRYKWPMKNLKYKINNYPKNSNMNSAAIDNQIQTAFNDWQSVSSLHFMKVNTQNNINVNFVSKDHGDGAPFDGPFGVLAHAFFPTNGRLHFDDDEKWSGNVKPSGNQFDLRQVATHEIGHLLGLTHSSVKEAVMFPFYKYKSNFKLQPDDVSGIKALYG